MIIIYESDLEAIREALPEPLQPAPGNLVQYEFIRMPDSSGFGDYTESGIVIPCLLDGQNVNFTAQIWMMSRRSLVGGRSGDFPRNEAIPDWPWSMTR